MGIIDGVYPDGVPVQKGAVRSFSKNREVLVMASPDEVAATDLAGQLIIALLSNGRLYKIKADDTTTAPDGSTFLRDVNGIGFELLAIDGVDGRNGSTIFVQASTPTTDVPAGSLWVKSDTADEDLYQLTGSPLAWVDTGLNLKGTPGTNGTNGSSAFSVVRAVATSNVNISSGLENGDAIDGVTLATGDLVLLAGQSTASQNGIYAVVASGAASRTTSFNTYDSMPGCYFSVMEGSAPNADSLWRCTSNKGGTLGTTALVFDQYASGGILFVSTIAALRAMSVSGLKAGQQIMVGGYASLNDGGGGQFTTSLSSVTDDGGVLINSTAGTASYSRNDAFNGQPLNFNFFGAIGDGTTNNTPALNALFAYIKAAGNSTNWKTPGPTIRAVITKGQYNFTTQPNDIDFQLCLEGSPQGEVYLRRNYSPSGNNGLFNFKAGSRGSMLYDLSIYGGSGTSGGSLISAVASSSDGPDVLRFRNLWLTTESSNTQTYTIYFDGSARTGAPIGIRDCCFENVHVFGSTAQSVFLQSIENFTWHGGGTFGAGGTGIGGTGQIFITGTSGVQSNGVQINVAAIGGGLFFSQTVGANINAAIIGSTNGVAIGNTSTASGIGVHSATISGTVQAFWTSSNSGF